MGNASALYFKKIGFNSRTRTRDILGETFLGFTRAFQASSATVTEPRPLHFIHSPVHYALFITPVDTKLFKLLLTPLNKPQLCTPMLAVSRVWSADHVTDVKWF